MSKYKLSNAAKEDLIRIHKYGFEKFGIAQADKYFETFFEYFEMIAKNPFLFESVASWHENTGIFHSVLPNTLFSVFSEIPQRRSLINTLRHRPFHSSESNNSDI